MMKIWKTIEIGGYNSEDDLINKAFALNFPLALKGFYLHEIAVAVLKKSFIKQPLTRIDLVKIKPVELGVDTGGVSHCSSEEVYSRAESMGLSLCPAEVIFELLLQSQGCPDEFAVTLAMKPVNIPFRIIGSMQDGPIYKDCYLTIESNNKRLDNDIKISFIDTMPGYHYWLCRKADLVFIKAS